MSGSKTGAPEKWRGVSNSDGYRIENQDGDFIALTRAPSDAARLIALPGLEQAALVLHNFIGNKHPDASKIPPEVLEALYVVRGTAR